MTDNTNARIFDKLDEMTKGLSDIRERLARVEEKQDSHYTENDTAHLQMQGIIVELKGKVEGIEIDTDQLESEQDKQSGKRQIQERFIGYLITLLSGGLLVAVGGYLAKMFGILR